MKHYIRLLKKWFWLPILGAAIAGGFSFYSASQQPETYTASAQISVGGYIYVDNPDFADIRTSNELASFYTITAETTENLQGTLDALDLDWSTGRLASMIQVNGMVEVPIIIITVEDVMKERPANIANAMAEQIVQNSPTNLTEAEQFQLDDNTDRINLLDESVAILSDDLKRNKDQQELLDPEKEADKLALLQQQYNTTLAQMNQALQNIGILKADNTRIRSKINSVKILEYAQTPSRPADKRVTSQAILGAIAGAGLAIGLVVILEYLNSAIRTSEEAVQVLGIPVLGTIAKFGTRKSRPQDLLITKQTHSLVLEGYRTLQTNLLFTAAGETLKGVYLVTSAQDGEGKSTTAVNLATTMALSGLRVLLIDADLHRPTLHNFFELDNSMGMATLLTSSIDTKGYPNNKGLPESVATAALLRCVQSTKIPNLNVITSGTTGGDSSGNSLTQVSSGVFLLQRFKEWVDIFRRSRDIDIVIFDTPPTLASVDSSILAATTEAEVILVIQAGRTKRDDALRTKGQFVHIGRELRGVVLNKTPRGEVDHGYGYGYYDDLQTLNVRPGGLQPELSATQQVRVTNPMN